MGKLIIHQEKITDAAALISLCPFGALELTADGKVDINAACRTCRLCVKRSKNGEIEYIEDELFKVSLDDYMGITVYADCNEQGIHPVTFELIGKARELANKSGQPLYCLLIGDKVGALAEELLHYPIDTIYIYEHEKLAHFRIEPYTAVFESFVSLVHPSTILVGATPVGRQLAPRAAARFGTGLTADCTVLDMEKDGSLVQIRPAFGGNIMAQIAMPHHRPQMATVRYKIMQAPPRSENPCGGAIKKCPYPKKC